MGVRVSGNGVYTVYPQIAIFKREHTELQEEHFLLLESFTKHPSRSATDHMSKSVLCGRCRTVNYQPLVNV